VSNVVAVVIVCCLYVNVLIVLHVIEASEWRGCVLLLCVLLVCQRADCVACNRN
jgi:hypothetical protein